MINLILFSIASLSCWVFLMGTSSGKWTRTRWGIRGGGGEPEPPAPPEQVPVGETSAEAIQAQIDALPKILAAQQQYGAGFQQQSLDEAQQFGPQYAQLGLDLSKEFGTQFAEQTLAEQDILDPSRSAGSRAIAEFLGEGPENLTDRERYDIQQDARSSASTRGLAESGFSAVDEVAQLFNARQALKSRYLNVALAASGRLPAAGGQSVQTSPQAFGSPLVQNVNPQSVFGAQASNNQMASSTFSTQGSMYGSQLANSGGGIGSILGSVAGVGLGALTGGMGTSLAAGLGQPGIWGGLSNG